MIELDRFRKTLHSMLRAYEHPALRGSAGDLDVRSALVRIDDGKFGRCLRCGGRIGIKILTESPLALACVSCQQKIDESDQQAKGQGKSKRQRNDSVPSYLPCALVGGPHNTELPRAWNCKKLWRPGRTFASLKDIAQSAARQATNHKAMETDYIDGSISIALPPRELELKARSQDKDRYHLSFFAVTEKQEAFLISRLKREHGDAGVIDQRHSWLTVKVPGECPIKNVGLIVPDPQLVLFVIRQQPDPLMLHASLEKDRIFGEGESVGQSREL